VAWIRYRIEINKGPVDSEIPESARVIGISDTPGDRETVSNETITPAPQIQMVTHPLHRFPARVISSTRRQDPVDDVDEDMEKFFREQVRGALKSVSGNWSRGSGEG
jgi:hypothetical protein